MIVIFSVEVVNIVIRSRSNGLVLVLPIAKIFWGGDFAGPIPASANEKEGRVESTFDYLYGDGLALGGYTG